MSPANQSSCVAGSCAAGSVGDSVLATRCIATAGCYGLLSDNGFSLSSYHYWQIYSLILTTLAISYKQIYSLTTLAVSYRQIYSLILTTLAISYKQIYSLTTLAVSYRQIYSLILTTLAVRILFPFLLSATCILHSHALVNWYLSITNPSC